MERCILAALALAAAMLADGQTRVTGYWDFRAPRVANNVGTYRETFFELWQDGEDVTGRIEPGGSRENPITEGTLRNGARQRRAEQNGNIATNLKFPDMKALAITPTPKG